jgi:hypothetical protein
LLEHGWGLKELADGPLNWKRLRGEFPDLENAYLVQTGFIQRKLVVPAQTFAELIKQIRALNESVLAGRLEQRVDESMPFPERRPLTPDLVEYERLLQFGRESARDFWEMLATLPPGQEWEPPPEPEPEQEEEEQDDAHDDSPVPAPTPTVIPGPPSRRPPDHLASDEILRDIEALAVELDALEQAARQGPEPYKDEQLDATVVAKRTRLLLELNVAGILTPSLAELARPKLVALGLTQSLRFHDAAMEMHRYFKSPGRARLVRKPAPDSVIDSDISLDWFMVPSGYVPDGVEPHVWLALCERNFGERLPDVRAGRMFLSLQGGFHQLLFRTELGPTPRMWRALPA